MFLDLPAASLPLLLHKLPQIVDDLQGKQADREAIFQLDVPNRLKGCMHFTSLQKYTQKQPSEQLQSLADHHRREKTTSLYNHSPQTKEEKTDQTGDIWGYVAVQTTSIQMENNIHEMDAVEPLPTSSYQECQSGNGKRDILPKKSTCTHTAKPATSLQPTFSSVHLRPYFSMFVNLSCFFGRLGDCKM